MTLCSGMGSEGGGEERLLLAFAFRPLPLPSKACREKREGGE